MTKTSSLFFLITVLFFSAFLPAGVAAEGAMNDQIQSQLDEIKTRLENMEQSQKEISAKDDKILEELDRLRVWVRRK